MWLLKQGETNTKNENSTRAYGLSRMWLEVIEEQKLEQVINQVQKLPDVCSVERYDGGHEVFASLNNML